MVEELHWKNFLTEDAAFFFNSTADPVLSLLLTVFLEEGAMVIFLVAVSAEVHMLVASAVAVVEM